MTLEDVREACARVCEEAAAKCRKSAIPCGRHARENWESQADEHDSCAAAIRALPLPPESPVERARDAFTDACVAKWRYFSEDHKDTGWEEGDRLEAECDGKWAALLAAEAAERNNKGGSDE